jgi:hypothetical protein
MYQSSAHTRKVLLKQYEVSETTLLLLRVTTLQHLDWIRDLIVEQGKVCLHIVFSEEQREYWMTVHSQLQITLLAIMQQMDAHGQMFGSHCFNCSPPQPLPPHSLFLTVVGRPEVGIPDGFSLKTGPFWFYVDGFLSGVFVT